MNGALRSGAMKRSLLLATGGVLLALFATVGCSSNAVDADSGRGGVGGDPDLGGLDQGDGPPLPEGPAVTPVLETEPVKGFGDAADDPAIWVHPTDPSLSLVLGTDKTATGGIYSYELDGSVREFFPLGEVNNVDLRGGFELDGKDVTLVTTTLRTDDTLVILALDPETRMLSEVSAGTVTTAPSNYGLCMYRSPEGKTFVYVNTTDGAFQQFELVADGDRVAASLVREFCVETQPEGCVADDEAGRLFVGEEGFGVWVFPAEAEGPSTGSEAPNCDGAIEGTLFASTLAGDLARDVEGMAIADQGDGEGLLIVSAQGNHEFVVFDRKPPHAKKGAFTVWGGGNDCIDGVEETDGLDVTTASLGGAFPEGLFVVQDGFNGDPIDKQNFKFVRFEEVLGALAGDEFESKLECNLGDYGGQARFADLPPGPERTEEFCVTFCGKCADCYEQGGAFSEGDCHYKSGKPNFFEDDCLAGCAVGANPADTRPLQPGWEAWECLDLDDAL